MKKTPATTKVMTSAPDGADSTGALVLVTSAEPHRGAAMTRPPAVQSIYCIKDQCGGTVTPRPKGLGRNRPVLKNTLSEAVATPTEKRGFVMPKFRELVHLHQSCMFYGRGGGYPQGRPHDFGRVLNRHAHPLRVRTQKVVLDTPEGSKTMTVSTQASRRAAPITPIKGNTHDPIQAFTDAHNALSMARHYVGKGNHAGAARKAAQALSALRKLAAFERLEVTA